MFLAEAWSAFSATVFPRRPMEVPSPLALILSPKGDHDTEEFFSLLWSEAIKDDSPSDFLNRYPLTTMEFNKTMDTPSEHEYLVFTFPKGEFLLERTISENPIIPDKDDVQRFLDHPESLKLIDCLLEALRNPLSSVSAAGATVGATARTLATSVAPIGASVTPTLLPLIMATSSNTSFPSMDEAPNATFPYVTTVEPQYSLLDQSSIVVAELLQKISYSKFGQQFSKSINATKPPKGTRAEDRFMGGNIFKTEEYKSRTMLGEFRPKKINLFHLALLALVVHCEYPLYALFMNQCYWFSSTVFFAAQIIDRDLSSSSSPFDATDSTTDSFFLPVYLYIPEEAGRWKGIRINGCKKVVLNAIVKKFHQQLAVYKEKAREETEEKREINSKLLRLKMYEAEEASRAAGGH